MAKKVGKGSELTLRQRKVVKGLLEGKTRSEALIRAGYAESTSQHKASQIINQPRIQSFLTDALEKVGLTADVLTKILKEAARACLVIEREGKLIQTNIPDHRTRLTAYDRIVAAYGVIPKTIEPEEAEKQQGLTVHFHLNDAAKDNHVVDPSKEVTTKGRDPVNVKFDVIER